MSMEIDKDILGMDGEDMADEIMLLRRQVQAARVEGLRRALELFTKSNSNWEWKNKVDGEIAALERGK